MKGEWGRNGYFWIGFVVAVLLVATVFFGFFNINEHSGCIYADIESKK